jgi:serine/threonine protein kinase
MAESSYPDALPAQSRLHWYLLERVLGQGGFGITYLARDTNLDQPVAIKEYLPVDVAARRADASVRPRTEEHGERYRWGLERFIREARTLARFDHPNIVRVHSVFELNNTAYMVMRFEEGENLAALLDRRRTLPEEELMRVLLPILDGLALVHNAGFIHRDIKPDNIHIRADGSPVLLDFGSARHAIGHARTVTILVAPGYAPFEQYYSTGENQGPWTDLYSLGATCYRAIAGVAPMDAIARSKGILGSTRELLTPAKNVGAGRYSARLLAAIDHALEFGEKDRPQTIDEWRRELGAAPARATRAAPPPASPPATSLRGPVVWATLGALVAAAAVVFWLVPRDQSGKLASALERAESARQELEAQRSREIKARESAEAEARRLREEQAQREAERRRQAEAAAAATRKPEPVRVKKATEAPVRPKEEPLPVVTTPVAAPALPAKTVEPPVKTIEPAPAPPPDLVALAEQARARGSLAESLALYRKAADAGNAAAQFALGELYAAGQGVPQNNFQAYVWFSRAERGGHARAGARVREVGAMLQPAEVEHAKRLLR